MIDEQSSASGHDYTADRSAIGAGFTGIEWFGFFKRKNPRIPSFPCVTYMNDLEVLYLFLASGDQLIV